jgi:uncharacterized protein with PCYCGC motif
MVTLGPLPPLPNSGYNKHSLKEAGIMMKRGFTLAFLALTILAVSTPWATSQQEGAVPAYNAGPPAKGENLPPILGKEQLWAGNAQYPFQSHAYELAAKIPAVLHQQPCYCFCDRGMGHNSLHSCFEGTHGAQCSVCLKELYYSYSMHQKKKTAAQIRQGIIKGEWKQVDLQTAASIN